MKKILQTASGFTEVNSDINPEYFSPEELAKGARLKQIVDAYTQAIADLETIQNTVNPTNAQVIWAIKQEASIVEGLLKFIKNDLVDLL